MKYMDDRLGFVSDSDDAFMSQNYDELDAEIENLREQKAELVAALQACILELDRYEYSIDNATRIIRADARAALAKAGL